MARSLRLEFPGAFYHVLARGNRRERIFLDDTDRRFFLQTFGGSLHHDWLAGPRLGADGQSLPLPDRYSRGQSGRRWQAEGQILHVAYLLQGAKFSSEGRGGFFRPPTAVTTDPARVARAESSGNPLVANQRPLPRQPPNENLAFIALLHGWGFPCAQLSATGSADQTKPIRVERKANQKSGPIDLRATLGN